MNYFITFFTSIFAVGINYLITFFLTAYITTNMGVEAFGLVSLSKNIANFGILLTSCLNLYSSRYITVEYHRCNYLRANIIYNSILWSNIALLVSSFFIGVLVAIYVSEISNVSLSLKADFKVLLYVAILNFFLVSLTTVFNAFAFIRNKLFVISSIKALNYIIEAILIISLFLFFKPKISFIGFSMLVASTISLVFTYSINKRYTEYLKIDIKYFSFDIVKEIICNGMWNSLNTLGNILNSGLDLWVSNILLSTFCMGQLSIVKSIELVFSTLFQLLSQPFQPILLKYYSSKDIRSLSETLCIQIKLSGYFSLLLLFLFSIFGETYYRLWTPTQDFILLNKLSLVILYGYVFYGLAYPLFYVYTLTLNNKIPCLITILSGVLNVSLMYVLIVLLDIGLVAVVVSTAVLGFFTFFLFTPIYSSKCLELDWNFFYKSIVQVLFYGSLMFSLEYLIIKTFIININSWIELIVVVTMISILNFIPYALLILSNEEKKTFIKLINYKRIN